MALSGAVYVWNASTTQTDQLFQLEDETIVTSLSWIKEGNILAVGLDNGTVEVRFDLSSFDFLQSFLDLQYLFLQNYVYENNCHMWQEYFGKS